MNQTTRCWCGSDQLDPFCEHYVKCRVCGSLVCHSYDPDLDDLKVRNDNVDFYGREYWLSHQTQDYDHPDIYQRARLDLPERALYWLKILLKYKIPPGKALELGSAHGGFVAMMQWTGFDAVGLDMSPWVLGFAQTTFDVPMVCGPIEDQQFEPNSFDVIALMDVLEHLPDPLETMQKCVEVLKPGGILLIQTPCYRDNKSYSELINANDPFLIQFKETEHLHLFTENSVKLLFERLGLSYIYFEPAIFTYDMFFVVSRFALSEHSPVEIGKALSASPSSRLIMALLDLDNEKRRITDEWQKAEADRFARLEIIRAQGQQLNQTQTQLNEAQTQLNQTQTQLNEAQTQLNQTQAQLGEVLAQRDQYRGKINTMTQRQVYKLMRRLGKWEWLELETPESTYAAQSSPGNNIWEYAASNINVSEQSLATYQAAIDTFNDSQPNKMLLDSIRAYNHTMIKEMNAIRPLRGSLLLDIGASPHGYALEQALSYGVALYIGIGLDVVSPQRVRGNYGNVGLLTKMDATALQFPVEMFDAIISLSTFEHITNVETALAEMTRVLKPGGVTFLSFEPIWSCSYGHHLHHFGECAKLVPPWAHLIWTPTEMRQALTKKWPADAPLSLEQAIEWTYSSDAINRLSGCQFREIFENCPFNIEWIIELKEEKIDQVAAQKAATITGLSIDELATKGFSVLLAK
jgi:2-polyprenyl-3-methyl-5-hydroxy-6-metoxy-1,4-benzoquinol methylase